MKGRGVVRFRDEDTLTYAGRMCTSESMMILVASYMCKHSAPTGARESDLTRQAIPCQRSRQDSNLLKLYENKTET